jgi:GH18 family chitinase
MVLQYPFGMKILRNMLCLLVAGVALVSLAPGVRGETRVVAYVPNWADLKTYSKTIPYSKLTHINVAFENASNAAGDLSFDRKDQALIDAAHAAGVKVLVSIGGGSASTDKTLQERYNLLMSEKERAAWAVKIAEYLEKHQFDGIDIDI